VSIEERILNFIEEGCDKPSWEGKELRAIALEVRKREDRIKQLEEMYEGIPGERPDLLGTNVMGLLKRELIGTQKRIKRLEELGHQLRECARQLGWTSSDDSRWIERADAIVEAWDKEVKP
jgi:hypothetical protein